VRALDVEHGRETRDQRRAVPAAARDPERDFAPRRLRRPAPSATTLQCGGLVRTRSFRWSMVALHRLAAASTLYASRPACIVALMLLGERHEACRDRDDLHVTPPPVFAADRRVPPLRSARSRLPSNAFRMQIQDDAPRCNDQLSRRISSAAPEGWPLFTHPPYGRPQDARGLKAMVHPAIRVTHRAYHRVMRASARTTTPTSYSRCNYTRASPAGQVHARGTRSGDHGRGHRTSSRK